MIAEWIEVVTVQTALVRAVQSFVHFEVENMKPQFLRLANVVFVIGYLDLEFRHWGKSVAYRLSLSNHYAPQQQVNCVGRRKAIGVTNGVRVFPKMPECPRRHPECATIPRDR